MKTTLVIGASENLSRYSNIVANRLVEENHSVILYGKKIGEIAGHQIESTWNPDWEIDTVTLYLNPQNQISYYNKIIALNPRRVIFNPGTENPELIALLKANGVETEIACTLVMLSLNQY